MEDGHVKTAVNTLSDDIDLKVLMPPQALLFTLYGSHWVRLGNQKQLYCFQFHHNASSYLAVWQAELEARPVREHIWHALVDKNIQT